MEVVEDITLISILVTLLGCPKDQGCIYKLDVSSPIGQAPVSD